MQLHLAQLKQGQSMRMICKVSAAKEAVTVALASPNLSKMPREVKLCRGVVESRLLLLLCPVRHAACHHLPDHHTK